MSLKLIKKTSAATGSNYLIIVLRVTNYTKQHKKELAFVTEKLGHTTKTKKKNILQSFKDNLSPNSAGRQQPQVGMHSLIIHTMSWHPF